MSNSSTRWLPFAMAAGALVLVAGTANAAPADTGTYDVGGSSAAATNLVITERATTLSVQNIQTGIERLAGGGGSAGVFARPTASISSGNSGFAAGDGQQRFGIWANGSYSRVDFNEPTLRFDGDLASASIGGDYLVMDNLAIGLSLGYESADITTAYNTGSYDADGFTIAPYAALQLGDNYVLSGIVGFTRLDNEVTRTNRTVRGSFDSDRWFGNFALSGNWEIDRFRLGATIGYLFIEEERDGYTESGPGGVAVAGDTARFGQGRLGGTLGYSFGSFTPYVLGRIEHEFTAPSGPTIGGRVISGDDTGYVVGLGVNFDFGSLTGGLEANSTQGRDELDQYTVLGTIRLRF